MDYKNDSSDRCFFYKTKINQTQKIVTSTPVKSEGIEINIDVSLKDKSFKN